MAQYVSQSFPKCDYTTLYNALHLRALVDLGQRGHVRAELCPRSGRRQRQLGGDREERARRDVAVLQVLGADAAQVQDEDQRLGGQRDQAGERVLTYLGETAKSGLLNILPQLTILD